MIIVAFVCLYVYCVQSVSCLESIGNSLWHCGWVKMEKGPVVLLDQKWWILSYRAPVGADKSRKEKNLNQNISSLQSTLWSRRVQAKNLKRIFLISEYNQSINYSTLIHCEKKTDLIHFEDQSFIPTTDETKPPRPELFNNCFDNSGCHKYMNNSIVECHAYYADASCWFLFLC